MSILNEPAVKEFLQTHRDHRGTGQPLAVFDCDGTVIKGDIGEAMLYYQIEHFLFRISPAEIWTDHPEREELGRLYDRLKGGDVKTLAGTPAFEEFADIILSWYFGQIADGKVEKACANIVQLFAGYSAQEVREIAERTFKAELHAPSGERKLGKRTLPRGIRFIRESVRLIGALRERNFQIWAISGSSKWSVEPVFHRLGVPAEQVIGISIAEKSNVLTSTVHDPVPIRRQKIDALQEFRKERPALVASDSRNDIPLFEYSTGLKVLVNSRRKSSDEFFQASTVRRDSTWVVIERPTIESRENANWQTFR